MVRIHSIDKQKRVVATDSRGRLLSIPEDYPIKFEILDNRKNRRKSLLLMTSFYNCNNPITKNEMPTIFEIPKVVNIRYDQKSSERRYLILCYFIYAGGKRKRLKDIVNNTSYKFPLHVEFEKKRRWTFRIGSQKYSSTNFGNLTLEREHWQTFLKGNTINNGLYSTAITTLSRLWNLNVKPSVMFLYVSSTSLKVMFPSSLYCRFFLQNKFKLSSKCPEIIL